MAEFVQQSIEEMLPELEQMERVELFTAAETRSILKKRKAFEYRLRRRTKQKDDFLQYIQYEMNVLALVKKRRERIGYTHKRVEIDVAIVQRIHKLFKLACFRFQDDVKLWLSHLEFCKKRDEKATVSKVFTRMLQVHNRKPALWISAAKHEMETCLSMENARQLLQRGLRFNPQSKLLWQEYFRMEMLNAEKVLKRKKLFTVGGIENSDDSSDAVLQGKVAHVIYKKALENFPDDVEFMLSFLPICRIFDFAKHIEDDILKSVQECHGNKEVTWEAVAKESLHKINALKEQSDLTKKEKRLEAEKLEDECFSVFEQATKVLCTEKMYDLYLKTCLERMALKGTSQRIKERTERVLRVFEEAASCHCLSESMALKWVDVLEKINQTEVVSKSVNHICSLHPTSVKVWKAHIEQLISSQTTYDAVYKTFKEALSKVQIKESLPLWETIYDWLLVSHPEKLEQFLEMGITKCAEISKVVKLWYLDHSSNQGDINKVRTIYKRISASQPLSLEFFHKYIEIEKSQAKIKMKRIREAYEDAVREYGATSSDVWIDYIKLELGQEGQPENAGKLHWRAVKALEGELNERFIAQYTLLQTGHL